MKLSQLLESSHAVHDKIEALIKKYVVSGDGPMGAKFFPVKLVYNNGGMDYLSNEELLLNFKDLDTFPEELKLKRVIKLGLSGDLKTLDNIPASIDELRISDNNVLNDPKTDVELKKLVVHNCKALSALHKMNVKNVTAEQCPMITSFKAFPEETEILNVSMHKITSFKDIHKDLPNLKEIKVSLKDIKSGYLDLIKCEHLEHFVTRGRSPFAKEDDESRLLDIVNKYAGQGLKGAVKAQREMIESDLEDYE